MVRLFIGLRPPSGPRAQLGRLMTGLPGVRWQRDDQLHLTLRFIGEVENSLADDITSALETVAAPPLALHLDGVGLFGTLKRPRLLWAGIAPSDRLRALHDKVSHALHPLGLTADERKFAPHITLARFKNSAPARLERYVQAHAALTGPPFAIEEFILFSSFLSHTGAIYKPEARFTLREKGA